MGEPHDLAERKLEFRTMLKRVADQFRPDDVESVAFIHTLPATEPRTALGTLSWLERKGMFSHNDVEPLQQLLDRIYRCDIIHNCGVREYQEQYCSSRERERQATLEQGGGDGSPLEPEITAASIDQLKSEVNPQLRSAQLLSVKQVSTNSIPLSPDEADTRGSSPPRSTPKTTPGVLSTDQTPPEDAPVVKSEYSEPLSTSPPDNADPLLFLSPHQKKQLLERIASDEDMRVALLSMVEQYPTLVPASHERPTVQTSDLPHPLHHAVDATDSSQLPSMEWITASSPAIDRPLLVGGPPAEGNPPEPGGPPAGGRLPVISGPQAVASGSPHPDLRHNPPAGGPPAGGRLRHNPPAGSGKDTTQKDSFIWKFKRSNLAKSISSRKDKTFSKELKVRADGYSRCKPVTLKFQLHSHGIGHDRDNSASLQVSVTVSKCSKCQPLKQIAQLNLDVTVQIAEGNEFLATRSMRKDLSDFYIHDFLPHEVICNPEHKAQNIEITAEAYLRFDSVVPPIATVSEDDWVEVAPQAQR